MNEPQKPFLAKATTAISNRGRGHNISRDEPSLCIIQSSDRWNYYGRFITGFGFIDVKFPKKTVVGLTAEEKGLIDQASYSINSTPIPNRLSQYPVLDAA